MWRWDLGISREKAHHVHFLVGKYSLSKEALYSEPVVFSDFLAIIYCLYNFKVNCLMPINLKKERACTLYTLHNKKYLPSIYLPS